MTTLQRLTIVPVTTVIRVHRIVPANQRDDPAILDAMRSNYERGRPLRPGSPEETYRALWFGVSMYLGLEDACRTALQFPRLGTHVACVVLPEDGGFSLARWGPASHVSVWGDATRLLVAVADIVPVRDRE